MATLPQLVAAAGTRTVVNWLNLNSFHTLDIFEMIRRRWPGTTEQSARALRNRAIDAHNAAQSLENSAGNVPLRANEAPRTLPGCTRWRYYMLAQVDYGGGNAIVNVPYTITSPQSLTRDDLEERTIQGISAPGSRNKYDPRRPGATGAVTVGEVVTIAVDRVCE